MRLDTSFVRRNRHEAIVAAYAMTYLVSLALLPSEPGFWRSANTILYFGICALTVGTLIAAAWRATDLRRRLAWSAFAASNLALWSGGLVWTFGLAEQVPAISPVLIELGYLPLAVVGFILLAADPRAPRRDPRVRFDAIVFAVGALTLTWHFDLRPFLANPEGVAEFGIVTIAGEWAVVVAASVAFLRVGDRATRDAVGLILAGHLTFILADYFYSLSPETYAPMHWIDTIWFLAWMLRWAGARRVLRATLLTPSETEAAAEPAYQIGLASSLFLIGTYVLLLAALLLDEASGATDLAVATTAMTALLVGRQQFALAAYRRVARATVEQTARFRALAAAATDLVLVLDETLQVTFASPSVERFTGPIEGSAFGPLLHPDDRGRILADLADRSASSDTRSFRGRIRDPQVEWRDVEFRVQDRRTDPLVSGFVLNGHDISAELALEGKLGHARKLATLSEMAGRIAHAFNNALAVVQGHAELMSEQLPANAPAREDVRAIRTAAERGAGITRQLLGFSGRQLIRPESLRPRETVESLMPMFRRLVPQQVTVSLAAGASERAVVLDRAQFEQVLVNLVVNARDGMPKGGQLRIAVTDDGPMVAIRVSDEGTGIPAGIRDRIFEPFFTTKSPGFGTGLGLAMVESIAKRAGGRIEFETEVGRGTTFTLLLPGVNDASPIAAATASSPVETAAGIVLLVDDDRAVLGASSRLLRRLGFTVLEASDGEAALGIAADTGRPIDVLVTDLMMPGISGREVIERFRVLRPGTPIVCVTGFAAERDEDASLAPQVQAIVAKPFTVETLRRAVVDALASAEASRSGRESAHHPNEGVKLGSGGE